MKNYPFRNQELESWIGKLEDNYKKIQFFSIQWDECSNFYIVRNFKTIIFRRRFLEQRKERQQRMEKDFFNEAIQILY